MSQENLINNNKQANSRLALTDEHKQDGGPQNGLHKRICKKFDNVGILKEQLSMTNHCENTKII